MSSTLSATLARRSICFMSQFGTLRGQWPNPADCGANRRRLISSHVAKEIVTHACIQERAAASLKRAGRGVQLRGCAACGEYSFAEGYKSIPVSNLALLQTSDEHLCRLGSVDESLRAAFTVHQHGGQYYHLHGKFVDADSATLCRRCADSVANGKIPRYSLKEGFDYGNISQLNLPELLPGEAMLISRVRLFLHVVKIRSKRDASDVKEGGDNTDVEQCALQGHAIAFAHNAPERAAEFVFPRRSLSSQLMIQFYGTKEQWQQKYRKMGKQQLLNFIKIRPDVVFRWLRALKALNPLYADIVIDDTPQVRADLQQIETSVLESIQFVSDDALAIDAEACQDDVAHARMEPGTKCDTASEPAAVDGDGFQHFMVAPHNGINT